MFRRVLGASLLPAFAAGLGGCTGTPYTYAVDGLFANLLEILLANSDNACPFAANSLKGFDIRSFRVAISFLDQLLGPAPNPTVAWMLGREIECAIPSGARTGSRMKCIFNSNSGGNSRGTLRQLGPLEQELLEALWLRGTATVRELLQDGYQDFAYTTVMTTLDRLYKKNLLARQAEGRAFRYAPRVTREELHREVAGEAFRQLLDASPAASLPLSYLVEILTERDAQLLDSLREVVESKRRELRHREQANRDSAGRDAGGRERE